jgi:hypothetical protein
MNYMSLIFNKSGETVEGGARSEKGIGKEVILVPSFLCFMSSLVLLSSTVLICEIRIKAISMTSA